MVGPEALGADIIDNLEFRSNCYIKVHYTLLESPPGLYSVESLAIHTFYLAWKPPSILILPAGPMDQVL